MKITVERVEYAEIESMRGLYREEARCQIIHDSALRRSLADAYLILSDGRRAGYGGVWNKHYPDRIMEYYLLPEARQMAAPLFRELISASGAADTEAQTNMPLMLTMLYDYAEEIRVENILFEDATTTRLCCDGAKFRQSQPGDGKGENEWVLEPDGSVAVSLSPGSSSPTRRNDRVLDVGGSIAAWGGVLFHYNPPYGDVYMQVDEAHRRKGYGSYLVQELKRVCYEGGHRPAARCNPDNIASRLTLQRAGFGVCGRMLAGKLRPPS